MPYSRACSCAGAVSDVLVLKPYGLVASVEVLNVVRGPILRVVELAIRLCVSNAHFLQNLISKWWETYS